MSTSSSRYVALLRGVNVGGKNSLAMADLVALCGELGMTGARTYIQSGNVVFDADAELAAGLPGAIAAAILARTGLRVPVVLRTAEQLRAVIAASPFARADVAHSTLHVGFLADEPTAAQVATLDPLRSEPDRFAVIGREVHLHCPDGIGRSKLTTQYFDSRLGTVMTVRNWNTVVALTEMASA